MSVRQRQVDSVVRFSLHWCIVSHRSITTLVNADIIYQQIAPDNEYYLCLASDLSNRQVIRAPGINERISDIYWESTS